MAYKNNLLTGITDLLVLSILAKKDSYVYEITKTISKNSNGMLSISHNTVYAATFKLEEANMVSEYSKLVGKKRTRIYYHLEPNGRAHLEKISEDYSKLIEGVKNILESLGGDAND